MSTRIAAIASIAATLSLSAASLPAQANVRDGVVPRRAALIARDTKTGDLIWRKVASRKSGQLALVYVSNDVVVALQRSCPGAPDQGDTFNSPTYLVAFNATSGDRRWRVQIGEQFNAGNAIPYLNSAADTVVIADQPNGALRGFDAQTGEHRWSIPDINSEDVAGSRKVLVVAKKNEVLTIDRRTGDELWGKSFLSVDLPVSVGSDAVVVTVRTGANTYGQRAFRLSDGKSLWEAGTDTPLLHTVIGTTAYAIGPFDSGDYPPGYPVAPPGVSAYDVHDHRELWRSDAGTQSVLLFATGPGSGGRAPIDPLLSEQVLLNTEQGLIALDAQTGDVRWARDMTGLTPLTTGRRAILLYEGEGGGSLRYVDARSGRINWKASVPGTINTAAIGKYVYLTDSCLLPS